MNEKLNFIFGRRSIRQYTNQPVADEDIQAILEAGMAAPSACACDPCRIIVLTERAVLDKVADILPYGKMLHHAPLGFIICGDISQAHTQTLSYLLQDCAAAIENMLLSIHTLGLGAVWLGIHPREERITAITKLFNLPKSIIPVSAMAVGYPAETKPPRTRFKSEYVHFNRW